MSALEFFEQVEVLAFQYEVCKHFLIVSPSYQRPFVRAEMLCYDEELDRAWDMLGFVAEYFDDTSARVVAEKYVFCNTWQDAANNCDMTIDKAKKTAYEALRWLDAVRGGK